MKKKLLLADDSITIQKVVGIIFAPEDYDLQIASDGNKAYEMALSQQPDLVIADIAMPGKDGFELCREIKSNPLLAQTSVLLLPGAFEKFDEARAVEVCADGWLTKPFESQVLLDKVASLSDMPPLRLVSAEEPVVEADITDMGAAEEAPDETVNTVEEDSFADQEELDEQTDDRLTGVDIEEEDANDGALWGEVSFEEDDLTPQDLLAAGDQDDDEDTRADYSEMEESPVESSSELTPEQLAPYVSATAQTDTQKEVDAPQFEPIETEENQEEEKGFGFITGEEQEQEGFEPAEVEPVTEAQPEEDSSAFEFSAAEADDTPEQGQEEDADEVVELMEEDLDQEEELVEDPDTFIDLAETDEALSVEDSAAVLSPSEEDPESAEQEEILDLTEGDVVADTSYAASEPSEEEDDDVILLTEQDDSEDEDVFDEAAVELTAPDQEPMKDSDHLFTADEDEFTSTEAEQMVAPDAGRRDDDLFVDDDEDALYSDSEDDALDDVETKVAESVVSAAPGTVPAAGEVEEQLRQLPEGELKNIIEKVAGPMIESLAREMLEQIVWEVVPDLAETMISAEIEKIKRGEH